MISVSISVSIVKNELERDCCCCRSFFPSSVVEFLFRLLYVIAILLDFFYIFAFVLVLSVQFCTVTLFIRILRSVLFGTVSISSVFHIASCSCSYTVTLNVSTVSLRFASFYDRSVIEINRVFERPNRFFGHNTAN